MEGTLRIQVIHVAGLRMIAKGTDGLYIGLTTKGIISGEYFLSFLPLNMSSLQRSNNLLEWINSWWGRGEEVPLTPEDWFQKVQVITG